MMFGRSRAKPAEKAMMFRRQIESEAGDRWTAQRVRQFYVIACVMLFVAGLIRYRVNYDPHGLVPRNPESLALAYNLDATGQFANPFQALATGPSAHLAPLFPAFLALLMKVFGNAGAGLYAIQLAATVILSLQLALFPVFSRMLGMGALNGFLAASIWIVAKVENLYMWESFYAGLLLALACCCYRRYMTSQGQDASRLRWVLGCLMGVSILIIPTVAPIFAVWVLWEFWRARRRLWIESLFPLILLPALVIAPWMIRNYRVFHHVVFIRDDLGLELSVSNNDCAQFGISMNNISGCFFKNHPNISMDQAKLVSQLGEVEYNRLRLRDAMSWIIVHPTRFAKLTAMRFVVFWIPNESGKIFLMNATRPAAVTPNATAEVAAGDNDRRLFERAVIYLMTLFSGAGLLILYRRDTKSMAVCMSCLTVFPLIYYVVQFEDRYRYPTLWVTFLLGALPITAVVRVVWRAWLGTGGPQLEAEDVGLSATVD
jgi:hypothetical protein